MRIGGGSIGRVLLIAAPFALIALGAWCLFASPLLPILRLVRQGAEVRIVPGWRTVGLPALAAVCFVAALATSLFYRRR